MRRLKLSTLIAREMWPEVLERINSHPDEVHTWDNSYLPLHRACRYASVPNNVVEALIEAYPESVQMKAKSCNRIALHCTTCLFNPTNADVVEILLRRYREGASLRDVYGQTPLVYHLRQAPSPSLEVVEMLVEAYPDSASTGDHDGCYPLHCAAKRGEVDIANYLIEMYPDALLEQNKDGRTPQDMAHKDGKFQLRDKLIEEEEKRFGRHQCSSPISMMREDAIKS